MEERQRKIREGAGLEESRLNTEFIEFLKKFSTPLLLAIVVISGGYFAWNKYKQREEKMTDDAFAQFDAAGESRNPVTLLRVAEEHPRGAVPFIARLTAADLHLDASRTGVPIGVTLESGGALPKDTQALTDEQRGEELKKATDLYQQVLDLTANSPKHLELTLISLHGLAACAESRGDLEPAKAFYQRIVDQANAAGLTEWATRAERLKATVDDLKTAPRLYTKAELPASAASMQPFTSGMSDMTFKTSTGETMKMGADGKLEKVDPATLPPGDGTVPPATPPTTPPADQPAATPATPTGEPAGTAPATAPAPAPATPATPPAAPATPAGEPPKPN